MKPAIIALCCLVSLAVGSLGTAMALVYRASQPIACEVNCTDINMKMFPTEVQQ